MPSPLQDKMLHPDFAEMLRTLCEHEVDFLVVGAHAMAAHGLVRATGDIDIWVRPVIENAQKVWAALAEFGAGLDDLTPDDLTHEDTVFQIGVAPIRIDILAGVTGLDFDTAWANRKHVELDGLELSVPSRAHLVQNKRATGRPKDIGDAIWLESLGSEID